MNNTIVQFEVTVLKEVLNADLHYHSSGVPSGELTQIFQCKPDYDSFCIFTIGTKDALKYGFLKTRLILFTLFKVYFSFQQQSVQEDLLHAIQCKNRL